MVARNRRFSSARGYSRSDAQRQARREVQEDYLLPRALQDRLAARELRAAGARMFGPAPIAPPAPDALAPGRAAAAPASRAGAQERRLGSEPWLLRLCRRLWAWWTRSL